MLILPAIDLKDGTCVRLLHGRFDAVTRYGDPAAQLEAFARAGARWVHMVDLDGARIGAPAQHDLIAALAASTDVQIQAGGGVRTEDHAASLLCSGVARVVIGSLGVRRPEIVRKLTKEYGPDRICLALDVRARGETYEVAVAGWTEGAGLTIEDALSLYDVGAVRHALVTDVGRDGAMTGPNLDLMRRLVRLRPDIAFQASGGVAGLGDLGALKRAGAAGVIIGRALYEGRLTVEDALAV